MNDLVPTFRLLLQNRSFFRCWTASPQLNLGIGCPLKSCTDVVAEKCRTPALESRTGVRHYFSVSLATARRSQICQQCQDIWRDVDRSETGKDPGGPLDTHSTNVPVRFAGSSTLSSKKGGFLSKLKWDFGFITGLKYPKTVLDMSGFHMYICCTEMVDHVQFFKEFSLPDTFNSWFLVTDLHIWLCMVRLASLGKDGHILRNCLVKALWEDMEERSKLLGNAASLTARREGVRQMADIFHASLFAYDEGLLGSDRDLAAASWRIFLEMREDVEPEQLELLVNYVRKQVAHLDGQDEKTILGKGTVTFLPLVGEQTIRQKASIQQHM